MEDERKALLKYVLNSTKEYISKMDPQYSEDMDNLLELLDNFLSGFASMIIHSPYCYKETPVIHTNQDAMFFWIYDALDSMYSRINIKSNEYVEDPGLEKVYSYRMCLTKYNIITDNFLKLLQDSTTTTEARDIISKIMEYYKNIFNDSDDENMVIKFPDATVEYNDENRLFTIDKLTRAWEYFTGRRETPQT